MADKKISELPSAEGLTPDDLLLIIDNPSDSPTNKNITVEKFFRNVPVAVSLPNGVEASSLKTDEIHLSQAETPVSSNDTESFEGNFMYDEDYLYIKIGDSIVKRVKLETF